MSDNLLELIGHTDATKNNDTKQCRRCKTIWSPRKDYFHKLERNKKDGYNNVCIPCIRKKFGSYFVDKKALLDGTSPFIEEGERWAVLVRYRTKINGYLISTHGRMVGENNKFMHDDRQHESVIYPQYKFYYNGDSLGGYSHSTNNGSERCRANAKAHRLVAETFMPIDENPPIPVEDWVICPESAKQWIRDTAFIDHIDDNKDNPHLDNLRWVTPVENNHHRKRILTFQPTEEEEGK